MMALLAARSDRSRALDWVQIGAVAGPTMELPSVAVRSANLRVQGTGQGSVSPAAYLGEGGTIPFMGMLSEKFPRAQLLVTGVLGPKSNAHGPNEFLHIDYAKKVTAATAMVIVAME